MTLAKLFIYSALSLAVALPWRAAGAASLKSDAEIKTLMGSARWDEAIAAARERVAAAPQEAEGHVLLGTAMFHKARASAPAAGARAISPAEADAISQELEAAIVIAPQRKDVYLGLIDVETAAGRDEKTLEHVKRCAAQFPADTKVAAALIEYGLERQNRQNPFAGPILQAVYQGYPRVPAVILAYAQHVMSTGELDQVTEMLKTATTQIPNNIDLLESYGDSLGYKLDFAGAAKQYGAASSLESTRRGVRLKWASALQLADPKSALILVDPLRSESKSGAAPTVEYKDGAIATSSRITRCASMLWKLLSQSSPSTAEIHNLAKTFFQSGLGPQALAETQVALVRNHNLVEAWMLRAEIYARVGLDRQALEALDKADAVFDAVDDTARPVYSHDEVLAARAASQSRLGLNEEALASYARMSDTGRYTYQTALVNEKLGRIEEARKLLEKVAVTGLVPAEVEAAKSRLDSETYRKKP